MKGWLLTAHSCAPGISFSYISIHVYEKVPFNSYFAISCLNLSLNPLCKWVLDNRVDYIDYPLFWALLDLNFVR